MSHYITLNVYFQWPEYKTAVATQCENKKQKNVTSYEGNDRERDKF